MKRGVLVILIVLLALITASGLFAQGQKAPTAKGPEGNFYSEGTKIVEQKITLKGFGSKFSGNAEWDDNMLVWQELEKRTNIRVEWETVVNTEARTKALTLFAANDLPDLFLKNSIHMADVNKFSQTGDLIDLKQFMDAGLMPNFKKAYDSEVNIRIAVTNPDGKIYTLPAYYPDPIDTTRRFMYINETWLKNVGKQKPTTLEEFYDVLRAFRDNDANGNGDPNDEFPLSMDSLAQAEKTARGLSGVDDVFGQPFNVIDGELYQMYTSENMKAAFTFLHTLYSEKLLEQDLFTRGNPEFFARLANNQFGITISLPPADSSQFAVLEPSFGVLGKDKVIWNWKVSPVLTPATFAITSKNKYPRETARWIDYFFSDEGATLIRMGVEGDTYKTNPDGSLSYTDKIKNDPQGVEFAMAKYSFWLQPNVLPGKYTSKVTGALFEGTLVPSCIDIFAPYSTKHAYSFPSLPADLEKERAQLIGEINKYYSESRAAFMTGKLSLDKDWDTYVKNLKNMKIDRLEEIYRVAYGIVKKLL